MTNLHTVYLSESDVQKIVSPILKRRLGSFGFKSANVKEEKDFDGHYVFRMNVPVSSLVPAKEIMAALGEIHDALRKKGEDRYVYLSTYRPGAESPDEDVE